MTVDCSNTYEGYNGGIIDDCDFGQLFDRYGSVSDSPIEPGSWGPMIDDMYVVDWSLYPTDTWYFPTS